MAIFINYDTPLSVDERKRMLEFFASLQKDFVHENFFNLRHRLLAKFRILKHSPIGWHQELFRYSSILNHVLDLILSGEIKVTRDIEILVASSMEYLVMHNDAICDFAPIKGFADDAEVINQTITQLKTRYPEVFRKYFKHE